ncbi:MAG: hypothetical protein M0R22_00285 [Dehalococcoidia bacterium]|nr:hypothetical protein [Dehalococcoidia bacterium]
MPGLFTDGIYRAAFSGTIVPPGNDANLYLCNESSGGYGSRINDYGLQAIFNDVVLGRAITDEEIANLHDAWESIVSVFEPKRTIWLPRKSSEIITPAALVQLAGAKNASSLVLDLTGNGRNGTVSGRVTQSKSPCCTRHQAHGAGNPLIAAAADTSLYPNSFSLELQYNARSRGQLDQGCLWSISDGGTTRSRLYLGAANTWYYEVAYASSTARWTFSAGAYNIDHELVLRHARSTGAAPTATLDGVALTVTEAVAASGALTAAAAPIVNRFNTAALDSDFDGALIEEKEFASVLSDADVQLLYLAFAGLGIVIAHRTDHPVSVAAVAAGGNVGPYRVVSGTHKWHDDGTRRGLLGVTAGTFVLRESSEQAYGGWAYAAVVKGSDAGVVEIPILASYSGALTATAQNAYTIRFTDTEAVAIIKYTAGVASTVATSADSAIVVATNYEVMITRRESDGYFSVSLKGGAYTDWTEVVAGTDTTFTSSKTLVGALDAGGWLA